MQFPSDAKTNEELKVLIRAIYGNVSNHCFSKIDFEFKNINVENCSDVFLIACLRTTAAIRDKLTEWNSLGERVYVELYRRKSPNPKRTMYGLDIDMSKEANMRIAEIILQNHAKTEDGSPSLER
jgi:hypothetical protein